MNENLKEINEIIELCNDMCEYCQTKGAIKGKNPLYMEYSKKINFFITKYSTSFMNYNYGYYHILEKFSGLDHWNLSAAKIIYNTIVQIKHEQFSTYYEKIFISHREQDKDQVDAFIELLHAIGIKRPTIDAPDSVIFCSSRPDCNINNGEPNLEKIKNELNTDKHTFHILWYTDNYFESPSCLNEAGAIWVLNKKYQEILMPDFDSKKIKGLLDKQPVWFRSNDKSRLNSFKEQIEKMFSLPELTQNAWEIARDKYINEIAQKEM